MVTSGLFTSSDLAQATHNKHLFRPRIQYKTCTLYKHNPKVSPFGITLVNKWQINLGDTGTMTVSICNFGKDEYSCIVLYWRFNTRLRKEKKKEWTKTIAN